MTSEDPEVEKPAPEEPASAPVVKQPQSERAPGAVYRGDPNFQTLLTAWQSGSPMKPPRQFSAMGQAWTAVNPGDPANVYFIPDLAAANPLGRYYEVTSLQRQPSAGVVMAEKDFMPPQKLPDITDPDAGKGKPKNK